MDMQNACREIITEVDGSLGCIVIDTQTGLTVAAASRPGAALNTTVMDLLSIIGTKMFCGQMIRRFEETLDRTESSGVSFVREVQMTTAQTNQFMSAIPGWSSGLLVLITDKSVSLGFGWMAVHRVVKHLAAPSPALLQVADAPAFPFESAVRPQSNPAALAYQSQRPPITSPSPSLSPAVEERPPSAATEQPATPSSPESVVEDKEQPKTLSAEAPTAANGKTPKAASRVAGSRMNMFSSRQHKKRGANK